MIESLCRLLRKMYKPQFTKVCILWFVFLFYTSYSFWDISCQKASWSSWFIFGYGWIGRNNYNIWRKNIVELLEDFRAGRFSKSQSSLFLITFKLIGILSKWLFSSWSWIQRNSVGFTIKRKTVTTIIFLSIW